MLKRTLPVLAGFAVIAGASANNLLWSQPSTTADGYYSDGVSTGGSQFYGQSIADDFVLATTSDIKLIRFWGSSENYIFNDLTNFASFDINIMSPLGTTVAFGNIPTGSFTITPTGFSNSLGGLEYEFELAIVPITLGAGQYWLNVGSVNVSPGDDAWVWSSSSVGDGNSAFTFFDAAGWQQFANGGFNQAFELEGDVVPEPATMAVLGLGAAALLRRRRK